MPIENKREEWLKHKKKNYENPISSIVSELLEEKLDKSTKLEKNLILNWNKIFEEYSQKIFFKKMVCIDKQNSIMTLHIEVKKEDLLDISYSKDILLDKIKLYLGYLPIKDIVIINK